MLDAWERERLLSAAVAGFGPPVDRHSLSIAGEAKASRVELRRRAQKVRDDVERRWSAWS